ncbi:hypothetical protein ADL21_28380 [Streptomyces albus subsp. albus]|nr:hypothetical protein ADL21_28380 [Streptomyces albus subsp. albus]
MLFAAVAVLFTGRCPGGIFALVMGLNRWVTRVVAYAALLTDAYPPFRLDLGAGEPAGDGLGAERKSRSDQDARAPHRTAQGSGETAA